MSSEHAGHDHTHGMAKKTLRLAFFLSLIIVAAEVGGGLLAHSLALLSDAGHALTDIFALGLAWFATVQAERPANARKTFGYHRVGILAALINAITLILVTGWIFYEAVQRFQHPEPVQPLFMFASAGIGIVGVVIVIVAAIAARSVALAGFGLDSLIEIFASVIVVWQLTGVNQQRERQALRLIGIAFIALVIYILAQLLYTLLTGTRAVTSLGGIAWITATFIAMLLLAFGKRITGQQLQNEVLLTEGRVTLVDAYLAGAVLVGLLLNALFGWCKHSLRCSTNKPIRVSRNG
jgi:divalent metal cation (Fe/Co/Zn/Cd) transporter